jgi:hypothetical protein
VSRLIHEEDKRHGMPDLVLRVELSSGERFRGTISVVGSDRVLAFDGWVSFMAAIDDIRQSDARCG